ncbi:MAG TPA: hypothetical protein VGJ20_11455 [Xanthobacteraceae bacterium]|jgi:hypothetical protein
MSKLPTKIPPLQRAYSLGYKRAMNRCRAGLQETARRFDEHLAKLQESYECVLREMRSEAARYQAIERALKTGRNPDDLWLN